MTSLPVPNIENWPLLYQEGAKARCIKDEPPMTGFGRSLRIGDVVNVSGVCWNGRYELAVREECAFYAAEGYFDVLVPE